MLSLRACKPPAPRGGLYEASTSHVNGVRLQQSIRDVLCSIEHLRRPRFHRCSPSPCPFVILAHLSLPAPHSFRSPRSDLPLLSAMTIMAMRLAALASLCFMLTASVAAFSWQRSSDAIWAHGCDYVGRDIGNARVRAEDCSNACGRYVGCNHFAWTLHAGGTCWFKGGASKPRAIISRKAGAVCGRMTTVAPVTVTTTTGPDRLRAYLPIFRFDDGAGSACFPDDKRLISSRDGKCRDWDPSAPVFYTIARCGIYTVYQYHLWYGKQKSCVTFDFVNISGSAHGNDREYVEVWVHILTGAVSKVRFDQHAGYYFKSPGSTMQMKGTRPVVYIGKNAHGAYHLGCNRGGSGGTYCEGGCTYWNDFRDTRRSRYVLSAPTLLRDPTPKGVDCNARECTPSHLHTRSSHRGDTACYGLHI